MKRFLFSLLKVLIKPITRIQSVPQKAEYIPGLDQSRTIVYVLPSRSFTDLFAVEQKSKVMGLPIPMAPKKRPNATDGSKKQNGDFLFLRRPKRLFNSSLKYKSQYKKLRALLEEQQNNPDRNIQLVPTTVLWGMHPGKENSLLKLMFADTANATWLRKLFILLIQGRQGLVQYSSPIALKDMLERYKNIDTCLTKISRTLLVHFHRKRISTLGPGVGARGQMINRIVATNEVQEAIAREVKSGKTSRAKATKDAKKYADEIASHFGYWAIQLMKRMLRWLWTKLYNGIEVYNVEQIRQLAQNHSIVYVPCHRSHIDYLVLSYLLNLEGLALPKIAAGINLNFWPAGPILRRSGAFFIRRSFRGNKLYTAVFNQYLQDLFNQGYSVEYFPEGGRSRTGRLLPPKTGLLAMTVQAAIRGTRKPIALVPVHIGYERIFEGKTYEKEMRGNKKKSESAGQLLGIRKKLKRSYGKVHVNFGEPIKLNDYLSEKQPQWQQEKGDEKPAWLTAETNALADNIMLRLNQAAVITPVNLLSLILLTTPRHALDKHELMALLDFYLKLLGRSHYHTMMQSPDMDAVGIYQSALSQGAIQEAEHPYGDIAYLAADEASQMTYYRNNILHLFAIPSLIAAGFLHNTYLSRQEVKALCESVYPLLKQELFMQCEAGLESYVEQVLNVMVEAGYLEEHNERLTCPEQDSPENSRFNNLADVIGQTMMRYAITLTLITSKTGLSRGQLEEQSTRLAERISILYGINAPEFSDKTLFKTFVASLKDQEVIKVSDNQLEATPEASALLTEVLKLMNSNVRQTLETMLNGAQSELGG